jgi:hypothetical protein
MGNNSSVDQACRTCHQALPKSASRQSRVVEKHIIHTADGKQYELPEGMTPQDYMQSYAQETITKLQTELSESLRKTLSGSLASLTGLGTPPTDSASESSGNAFNFLSDSLSKALLPESAKTE